jgi:hypothetical protein
MSWELDAERASVRLARPRRDQACMADSVSLEEAGVVDDSQAQGGIINRI